jgi:hypothetical protein
MKVRVRASASGWMVQTLVDSTLQSRYQYFTDYYRAVSRYVKDTLLRMMWVPSIIFIFFCEQLIEKSINYILCYPALSDSISILETSRYLNLMRTIFINSVDWIITEHRNCRVVQEFIITQELISSLSNTLQQLTVICYNNIVFNLCIQHLEYLLD